MRILLTGARGMLGRNLLPRLISRGHEVASITSSDVDLKSPQETLEVIQVVQPQCIIHLAARVGGIAANIQGGEIFFRDNFQIDQSVFQAALVQKVDKLIYMGSSCMYPANLDVPMTEKHLGSGPLEITNEPYAYAKLVGTRFVDSVSKLEKYSWRTLIASNLYGPFDTFSPDRAHMIAAVLGRMHRAKLAGDSTIEMWGDGTPRREFTYVGDIADFISENLENLHQWPSHMNIGIGEDHEVRTYYQEIADVVGFTGSIVPNRNRPNGTMRKLMDSSQALRVGWRPKTGLREGLELTMQSFLKLEADNHGESK